MPIYVEWKWVERTKSFLVIFHFYDDYSTPNLRMKMKRLERPNVRHGGWMSDMPVLKDISDEHAEYKPMMTWAPSHVELGLLSELLRYANLIDGLSEVEKRTLRPLLEVRRYVKKDKVLYEMDVELLKFKIPSFLSSKTRGKPYVCFELCLGYVDYLKKVLKPYIS